MGGQNFDKAYRTAIRAAERRFQPLTDALMRDLRLDVEPVIDQTGGMVMCLGIYWPDGAYVWFSDYWWEHGSLILGLYADPDDDGVYPEPPKALCDQLVEEGGVHDPVALAAAISAWATPLIREHGAQHGWASRFEAVT